MENVKMKKPPLIEALIEIKWELEPLDNPNTFTDSGFQLAEGIIFEKIKDDFPYFERKVPPILPIEMAPYIIRDQFRKSKNSWPLIQIGPGIATINVTNNYSWGTFYELINTNLPKIYDSYKIVGKQLSLNSVKLHYVNGFNFNWGCENILEYLKNNLNTNVDFPDSLKSNYKENSFPSEFQLNLCNSVQEIDADLSIRLSEGFVGQTKSVIVEISCKLDIEKNDVDVFKQHTNELNDTLIWLEKAHGIIENSFFSLIEGKLAKELI